MEPKIHIKGIIFYAIRIINSAIILNEFENMINACCKHITRAGNL